MEQLPLKGGPLRPQARQGVTGRHLWAAPELIDGGCAALARYQVTDTRTLA